MKVHLTFKQFAVACAFLVATTVQAQTPFWTEDFANGIGNWVVKTVVGNNTPSADWILSTTGPQGSFAIPVIQSATAANGYLLFDSDLNCSGAQDARIYSKAVNCASYTNVTLSFSSMYRRFNDSVFVMVSNDSINWTFYPVHAAFTNNQTAANPTNLTLDISAIAATQPKVYVGFRFLSDATTILAGTDVGCAYSWMVDDLSLLDGSSIQNSALSLVAGPRSRALPLSLADTITPSALVSNLGTAALSNVSVVATITNTANSAVVFTETVTIGTLPIGYVDSVFSFNNAYVPNAEGIFELTYTLSQTGNEFDPSDNTRSYLVEITDSTFANDNDVAASTYTPGGATGGSGGVGNVFYITDGGTGYDVYGSFGVNNASALVGQNVEMMLIEFDANNDGSIDENGDNVFDYTDLLMGVVASKTYTITGSEPTLDVNWVKLENFATPDAPITLNPEKEYFMFADYQGTSPFRHLLSEAVDYQYTVNNGELFIPFNTIVYGPNSNGQMQIFGGGFTSNAQAMVRMHLTPHTTATKYAELPNGTLNVFPNPTAQYVTLEMAMETASDVTISITGVAGNLIRIDHLTNVTRERKTYDVSTFPAGTYTATITTANGIRTERFVVAR